MNTSKQKNEPEKKQNMGSLNVTESFFKDFFVSIYASLQPTRARVACDKHFFILINLIYNLQLKDTALKPF